MKVLPTKTTIVASKVLCELGALIEHITMMESELIQPDRVCCDHPAAGAKDELKLHTEERAPTTRLQTTQCWSIPYHLSHIWFQEILLLSMHAGLELHASKITMGGIACPIALAQPTIVTCPFLPET